MKRIALLAALALAACSPKAPQVAAPDAPAPQTAATPADLKALEQAHDWQYDPGEKLNASWNDGVKAVIGKMSRPDAIKAITDAGFECTYGEAHEKYPDPMAVCTRSFATRECQMDWEISSTADKGMVQDADGSYTRDCVGVDRDWPEPKKSAIDDQLAPAQPPKPN
ncbi:MAG TPA: hypothetical protein VGO52_06390 [Hyphomonadaceae bacterium]|jgi:hypothetical protein|nr:hypothetical protein [Hyphomonadaceae bacterium]